MLTDAKLYVPFFTLSTEDNPKLSKLLSEGFKGPLYWNKYKVIPSKPNDTNAHIGELLDASYQEVKRLFVLAYKILVVLIESQPILTEDTFF